jgi:hypothetical protein
MTPDEILEIDAARNHPPGTVAGHLKADINENNRQKGSVVQQGNTLVMFRMVTPDTVEFHCFNADSPQNLIRNVEAVLRMFKKIGIAFAETPYANPKVSELFKQISNEFSVEIEEIPDGFLAKVRL